MQGNCRGTTAALRIALSLSYQGKEKESLLSTHRYLPDTVSISEYLLTHGIIAITYCLDSKPYRVFALKTIEGGREVATLPLTSERGAHSKNHTTRRELDSLCAVTVTRWKVRTPRWRRT